MNVMPYQSEKSKLSKPETFATKQPPSLEPVLPNFPMQDCRMPLYFKCLGGNWEGQIQHLHTGSLELQVQGFPPVKAGQTIQFQCFGDTPTALSGFQDGMIQKVSVQPGSSPWEGMTKILVHAHPLPQTTRTSFVSKIGSFRTEPGSFIFGRITEDEGCASSEVEAPTQAPLKNTSTGIAQHSNTHTADLSKTGNIQSAKFSILNADGHRIVAYHDYPTDHDLSTLPITVIAPGYGETKRDYLSLAYYFASNGFHVIRYDHTNHVGESDGDHYHISLSSMKKDFQSVTRYAGTQWPTQPIIGIATSLASRIAMKAEAECPSVSLLISLMGIMDVQHSLATVHQEDLFAGYQDGHFPESANVLGFNVSNTFLQDALENHFATLESTRCDAESLTAPVILVSAGQDAWVDQQDVQAVSHALGSSLVEYHLVADALHRLQENPKAAKATYRHVIQHCHDQLHMAPLHGGIQDPDRLTLGRQKREEKTGQQQQPLAEVGRNFWQDYLGQFQSISTCPDYVKLLDHVFHALGPITSGQQILDAGCGNGNAGLFFLHELQTEKNGQRPLREDLIRYIGIDIVPEALGKAKTHMTHMLEKIEYHYPTFPKNLQMSWAQVDLQHTLPFADNQFDRIVSNLVLGYVDKPQVALQELYRVLAPGGRMVLSNLKPNGDFSGIYKNLIKQGADREQKAEARVLLNNYGKIRQAEKEGQFCFFNQTEWKTVLDSLNCVHAGIYPTFANQAYLVVLEKPATSLERPLSTSQKTSALFQPFNDHINSLKNVA